MTVLEKYLDFKKQADAAAEQYQRAQGALEQLLHRLAKEHGCESLDEAQIKLKEINAEIGKASSKIEKEMDAYEKRWQGKL